MVFEGGGVAGIAYGGALTLMDKHHLLDDVVRLGGTSAGAITACLMGIGCEADEIQEIIWKENPHIFIMPSFRHEAWNTRFTGFNPSNRPSPVYGSYKLVYDTTITVPLFGSIQTKIASIVGTLVFIGLVFFNIRKRKYKHVRDRGDS